PALRDAFLGTAAWMERPLADVIADRIGASARLAAEVLAASVAAAVRVALGQWARPASGSSAAGSSAASGLVAVSGSLPELLRAALAPLGPALDAA
ncbi:MAG: TetR family transcriptional regulator, partial [Trebonia sp.]